MAKKSLADRVKDIFNYNPLTLGSELYSHYSKSLWGKDLGSKLKTGLLIGSFLAGSLFVGLAGAQTAEAQSLSQTVALAYDVNNHVGIDYKATLTGVDSATRVIKKIKNNGNKVLISKTTINISPYDEFLQEMRKGNYEFKLNSPDATNNKVTIRIPNYLAEGDFSCLEGTIEKGQSKICNLEGLVFDRNAEDPVVIIKAKALTENIETVGNGYIITINALEEGPYQVRVKFGKPNKKNQQDVKVLAGDITPVQVDQIAFKSTKDHGAGEIYIGDVSGGGLTNVRRLTNNVFSDSMPAWSPNGSQLASVSNRDLGNLGIYVMSNFDGSDQAIRITPTDISAITPTWCSNNKIYFGFSDNLGITGIASVNPNGTDLIRLVEESFSGTFTAEPSCSPDGSKIAFETSRDGNSEVYIKNLQDGTETNLTNNPNADFQPRWSSDNRIAFSTDRDMPGGQLNLYLINPDGSGLQPLTDFTEDELDLSWFFDSSKFAFIKGSTITGPLQIYKRNTDGTGLIQLTTEGDNRYPAWRPRP